MKKREAEPWMPAPDYGKSLSGLTVNLLVSDVARAIAFEQAVLGAEVVYGDPDFAVLRACGAEWNLHADHTYDKHPLYGSLKPEIPRGIGAEISMARIRKTPPGRMR